MKEQEAEGLLSNIRIRKPLSKNSIIKCIVLIVLHMKMNNIINRLLLAGDKFMTEMSLRQPAVFNQNKKQPGFIYSAIY